MDVAEHRSAPRAPRRAARGAPKASPLGLRRNDTSYPQQVLQKMRHLYGQYRRAVKDPDDENHLWALQLKYYQYLVRIVMTDPAYGVGDTGNGRGLLVYATMGMGKTRLAAGVAMAMWDTRPVVVLLPKSLQKNFRDTVAGIIPALFTGDEAARQSERASKVVSYVSMDAYNAASQVARTGLDGRLLIVDEAHNFFRAIINSPAEQANARRIYDAIMDARDLKILFLTGTPSAKDPFELVPCFNMLAGTRLLPERYERFNEMYVDRANSAVKNPGRLANRLVGLVSHVSSDLPVVPAASAGIDAEADAPAGKQPGDEGWFPVVLPTIEDRIPMGEDQYRQYLIARERENLEGKTGPGGVGAPVLLSPPLSLPGSDKKQMKSYHVRSRSLSNYAPPDGVNNGSPEQDYSDDRGPKLARIATRAAAAAGPVLIYSQFVSAGGLTAMTHYLQRAGFDPWDGAPDRHDGGTHTAPARPTYAVISGEVPTITREAIVRSFNALENAYGKLIKAILVSKTGAEGLDLKWIRETHQIEPYWDRARDDQVKARAARLYSHDGLPREQRVVQPYLYIAVANPVVFAEIPKKLQEPETIDETFYQRAAHKYALNCAFRRLLVSVSLECSLLGYGECRLCAPTGVPLFGDAAADLRRPDPCECGTEEVTASSVELDGTQYYYRDAGDGTVPTFYEWRPELDAHAEVSPGSTLWDRLRTAVGPLRPASSS